MKIYCLFLAITATLYGQIKSGIISEPSVESEYIFYTDEIRVIYNLLAQECPDWRKQEQADGRSSIITGHHLEVRKRLHEELVNQLIKCRENNNLSLTETTTKPTTTMQTTAATTTLAPQPVECQNAVNLTGAWRLDTAGQDLRGGGERSRDGYACDIWRDHWFRFSGDGGNKMLNACPARVSCGTRWAYWTDALPPSTVGVAVRQSMYVVHPGDGRCKSGIYGLSIMRCSDKPDDLIYYSHFADEWASPVSQQCSGGFCGMD